jgi:head-tail adaptor
MARPRNLGAMRHRITLFGIVRTSDGGGGFARGDGEIGPIMASISTLSTGEQMAYANLQQRATHRLGIRWRDDIAQGQSIRWHHPKGERDLYVLAVADARPEHPGEWLEIIAREGGNL